MSQPETIAEAIRRFYAEKGNAPWTLNGEPVSEELWRLVEAACGFLPTGGFTAKGITGRQAYGHGSPSPDHRLRDQIEHQEGGIGDSEIRALVSERDALREALIDLLMDAEKSLEVLCQTGTRVTTIENARAALAYPESDKEKA